MKIEKILTNGFFVTIVAIFCCALWGSATPFIKIGYSLMLPATDAASTILFAGIRFFIAGVLVVAIYSLIRKCWIFPKRDNWGRVGLVSLFQTVLQYIFFYIGLVYTTGVKGTVISGSGTFSAILIGCLVFRYERLSVRKMLACLIGFSGIVLINWNGLESSFNFFGDGFVFFATVCYGVSSSLMKRYSSMEDSVVISGYQFMLGGLVMMLFGWCFGGVVWIDTPKAWAVLGYLSFLSAVAYSLWGILLTYNPISKVAVFSFMIPVFGVLLSEWLLTESGGISPTKIVIALAMISFGILIQNDATTKRRNEFND
ncbi:MAG: EamA family transporter [Clostridia bacterium]|nr:EamA family transporter [Clostridia bacterium]